MLATKTPFGPRKCQLASGTVSVVAIESGLAEEVELTAIFSVFCYFSPNITLNHGLMVSASWPTWNHYLIHQFYTEHFVPRVNNTNRLWVTSVLLAKCKITPPRCRIRCKMLVAGTLSLHDIPLLIRWLYRLYSLTINCVVIDIKRWSYMLLHYLCDE